MTTNRDLGVRGEDIAARHLEEIGLELIERNWRCSEGEVDVVALDGDELVIVEVKTRSTHAAGHPLEAVTPAKLQRLRRLALAWSRDNPGVGRGHRIDVIGVTLPRRGDVELLHLTGVGS